MKPRSNILQLLVLGWLTCFATDKCSSQAPETNDDQSTKISSLPDQWYGTWTGTVQATSADNNTTQFQMRLVISPTQDPQRLNWTLIYDGEQGQSKREFLLVNEVSEPGQFVIDEQNGIRINAALLGNCLSSNFAVDGQRIWSSYRLESKASETQIHFELITASEADAVKSGGESGAPEVVSVIPRTRQSAVLTLKTPLPKMATSKGLPAWKKLETEPYRGKQDDIFFVDENIGWYVNGAGKIFKTVDGGSTWIKQLDQPGTYFRCVAFIDAQHGFAGNIGPGYFPNVTDNTPLYETVNGGETWTAVSTIDGEPVVGLCALQVLREPFINAGNLETRIRLIGVGRVGGPTAMITSDDLGKTWQQIDISQHAAMAFDVHFFNRNEGFIAAATDTDVTQSNALILATTDGGKSWVKSWQSSRPFEITWKMSFPTRETGYVTIQSYNPDPAVKDRFVAKTNDGGKTWSELELVSDAGVREFGIAFLDEKIGWVGAVPNGFQTTDGGQSWQPVEMGNAVNKIRLLETDSKHVGYAIGVNVHSIDIPKVQTTSP